MRTYIGNKIWRFSGALVLCALLTLGACDLTVTNPGPVQDTALNDAASFQPTVNGAIREFSLQLGVIGSDISIRAREVHPTAINDWLYVEQAAWDGITDVERVRGWSGIHAARWMSEDAIRRLTDVLGETVASSNAVVAQAYLWGGYIHRLMGEYYCEAVFDGGSIEPGTVYFDRAEDRFTSAIKVAQAAGLSDMVTAATAGRASVRLDLGDWGGAVSDASAVATDFSFSVEYFATGDWRLYNPFFYLSDPNSIGAVFTLWNSINEDYFTTTSDQRVPWGITDPTQEFGSGSLQGIKIPLLSQKKYPSVSSSVEISSGEEMRLIEAEALLRGGDMAGAMLAINDLRNRAGVADRPAPADINEAWGFLKRERGIELWLEGRRLMDLRRWRADNTPGALDPLELGLVTRDGFTGPDVTNRELCMPVPNLEREENANLPVL